jgi:hypothetical protein
MRKLGTVAFALSLCCAGGPLAVSTPVRHNMQRVDEIAMPLPQGGPPWSRQVSEAPLAFFFRPYQGNFCNFEWEQCMKTGLSNGRTAERR